MDWNKDKSLWLSKICIKLFTIIMIVVAVFAPKIFSALIEVRIAYLGGTLPYFLISTYTLCVPATIALSGLWRLLDNIDKGEVFIENNVRILRMLSWRCIFAGGICLVSAVYYLPFIIIAAAAGFVGLLLRIVKNVFARAVEIKQDNDFTI